MSYAMLWGSQMKTLTISKERRRGTRYTPILLKPNLTEEQIARFAVNQYKYPSLDVRPYFKRNYLYGEAMTHIFWVMWDALMTEMLNA